MARPDSIVRPRAHAGDVTTTQTNDDAETSALAAPAGEAVPARIGRFLVLGPLGQGGMSSVFRGYDPVLDRQVAIKVMLPGRHEGRVIREAQALARMSHPNVVQVYEVGETDDRLFLAMELIAGQSLQQWQQGRHPWRRYLAIYMQAGRGLVAAHAAGLIHRDFKPANCILDQEGRVRVLDFGLARHEDHDGAEDRGQMPGMLAGSQDANEVAELLAPRSESQRSPITRTSSVVGTRAYMAPEQLVAERVDARCDQFSFCVSLYEGLFGQRPFEDDPVRVLLAMASGEQVEPLPPPADRRVPRWLVRILWRGLSARPDDRWPSIQALLAELERRQRRQKVWWASWGVAAVGVAWAVSRAATPSADEPACTRVGQEVAALWSDERRSRIQAAMESTGLPYAHELWARVEPRLDAYVGELAAARVAACGLDTRSGRAQQRCLEPLGTTLHRTLLLLEDADSRAAERASDLVEGLPAIEHCVERGLLEDAEPARTPEHEQLVSTLRGRLQVARALERAAKHSEAGREAAAVVEQAQGLDDPAFLVESHLVEGFVLLASGEITRAEERLESAYKAAVELGLGRLELEAVTSLAYLVGVSQAHSDAGLWLASTAESLARRHDPGGKLEAEALTVLAQVLAQRGQLAEAEQHYREALGVLTSLEGDGAVSQVVPLNGLGQVLRRQGELEQAQALYERTLELRIDALGEGHPRIAYQRITLGGVLMQRRRLDEAELQLERARQILDALPAQGELLAELHTNLGLLRNRQGRPKDGALHLRRAIEAWEALYGPMHPWVAQTRMSLGANLERRALHEAAAEQYQRALQILEANEPTPTSDDLPFRLLRSLAEVRRRQGRHDEAEQHYRRALEDLQRRGRGQGLPAARLHDRLGELYFEQRRFEQAVVDHEAALRILDASPEQDPERLVDTLLLLGRAAHAAAHPSALDRVDRALSIASSLTGDAGEERVAEAQQLRARVVEAQRLRARVVEARER